MRTNTSPPSTSSTFSTPSTSSTHSTFYLIWLSTSLLQAWGTELFDDEAYYWVYAKFLDWGYFDHPPMIALLVKISSTLLHGELGVRLLSVVLSTASIWLLEKIIAPQNRKLFFAIILNISLLQILGILAVPDTPLLFFTVVFFWTFQRFTNQVTFINALLLAVVIGCLLYSKYHGILIILAALLSNVKLLAKPLTYFVVAFSAFLFLPHILWQVNHQFPSIVYQLFERVSPPYNISFTTDFVLGQLLIAGPFAGWLIIWMAFKSKAETPMLKAMRWSLFIFYGLFFISSFKGRTEANWTIPLIAPLVVLSYNQLNTDFRKASWLYKITPVSLVIVLLLRIYMFVDVTPWKFMPKDEFHGNKAWTAAVKSNADGHPVVFTDSYQRASKYWFYTGDTSFSLNTFKYRRSNYNFWPMEHSLQNKTVIMVGSLGSSPMADTIISGRQKLVFEFIDSFHSFSGIEFKAISKPIIKNGTIIAPLEYTLSDSSMYQQLSIIRPRVCVIIYQQNKKEPIIIKSTSRVFRKEDHVILFTAALPKGLNDDTYTVRFGLENSFADVTINSRAYVVE